MLVKIAGYNIDADLLESLKTILESIKRHPDLEEPGLTDALGFIADENSLTPETISAAYARISRDPAPISELRKIARRSLARARKSNEKIVFQMGHASVAEHAVFNIDISGISRLAVETIESRRLISFTEKSQRYIALSREFILPPELVGAPLAEKLASLCEQLFEGYHRYLPKLEEYFYKNKHEKPELASREDDRYLLPLACSAQLGMTANARNLEHLLRRTSRHPLMELREFALNLKTQLENKIPSLIRYVDSEETEEEQISPAKIPAEFNGNEVKLLHYDKNPDETVISGLLFESGGFNFEGAFEVVRKWDLEEKTQFLRQCLRGLKVHEAMPRAFETVHFGYQIPISAAAFGQLKRHRLTTQICRPYSPALGFILPESIKSAGLASDFAAMMAKSEAVHREIAKEFPPCASYALTNAHKRLVYFQANARELHHIARLRLDSTAQWDIRQIAANMINEARKVAPLIMALACGKDQFENTTQKFLA